MEPSKKIAFIKFKDFSHTNESLLRELKVNFPDYQIDVIELFQDLISKKDPLPIISALIHYGKDIVLKRQTIIDVYFRTPYIFNKIKRAANKRIAGKGYTFTIQTQSLFDASVPGIPHFLYTDHTHLANLKYPGFNKKQLLSRKWLECEKDIYHHAAMNFTMSSNISQSLIDDYTCDREKVACVYCGSNVEVSRDKLFDDARYSERNILFVGVDWQRKGGPTLAEAFKKVLIEYPDATLTIVGCSPVVNLPNCNIVGRIPLPEVSRYFEHATLFCMPTTIEPFGIVFLEAMAHQLPVIGSNIGAIPDFILEGQNGFLVEPGKVDQLSHKIIELLRSPEKCRSFGERGHKLFWDKYTWENTGKAIYNNITLILKNKKNGSISNNC